MRLQAQRLQKRELNQMRGIDGEDVHMASAKAPKQKSKKRTHGDVEMADAEVRLLSPLCTHTCLRATHFLRRKLLLRSSSILLAWTASDSHWAARSSEIDIKFEMFPSDMCSSVVRRRHKACVQ